MNRCLTVTLVALLANAPLAEAARARVVVHNSRTHVTVRTGFPIRRPLPQVVVRPAPVVRVTTGVYLAPVVFTGATVTRVPPRVWSADENLDREDGWTEFTKSVDRRGNRLLMNVADGPAQFSFAEVVFENGEAQIVDFDERTYRPGTYSLLDFGNGRKVDHVRVVAKAPGRDTEITLSLV